MIEDLKISVKKNLQDMQKERSLLAKVKSLRNFEILVGIPEENNERENSDIGNATLLYIHTKGSPVRNLPARPLIEPAITDEENAEKISNDFKEIALAVLEGRFVDAERLMDITGQDAVNMITDWFDSPKNNWPPVQASTFNRKLSEKNKPNKEELYAKYISGVSGIKTTLVDTNEMRKAITYVIDRRNK